jgi:hypothetical protein
MLLKVLLLLYRINKRLKVESNHYLRICNPPHYHYVIQPIKNEKKNEQKKVIRNFKGNSI